MQDRLKFRAIINNEMKDVYYFYELPTNKDVVFVCTDFENCKGHYIASNELVQCTGLKDVNNKPIYEGDIIKYMYYNPESYTRWVVVFDQNTLEFGLKDYRYGGYLRITRHSILNNKVEIIGNKFQNPELLNEVENDT